MQRTGRTGHAQFRVVVQDSRFHPTSGRVVAYVGNYDPHTKAAKLDGEKVSKYLANGAQPSDRVAKLLSKEGIKLPDWFTPAAPKTGTVRNADKRRSTRPAGAPEPVAKAEEIAETGAEGAKETETTEAPVESAETAPTADLSAETSAKVEEPTVEPEGPIKLETLAEPELEVEHPVK